MENLPLPSSPPLPLPKKGVVVAKSVARLLEASAKKGRRSVWLTLARTSAFHGTALKRCAAGALH